MTKINNISYKLLAFISFSLSKVELLVKSTSPRKVLVCLGRSCRKYKSEKVFANFKADSVSDTELVSVMCLGQCGNGAMVLIEPEQVWYYQVHPNEVCKIVREHLINNSPVEAMLYPKFHHNK